MPMAVVERSIEEALRPLNELERAKAPGRLFLEGDVTLLRTAPRVSIVGSRKASQAGLQRTDRLARELVKHDVIVVSGLALGIDTAAHRAAMDGGGKTIAVLGTPLDKAHPRQNEDLQQRIGRGHLLVSQFPLGAPIRPSNFARRNRTMALLCHASVIVEAGESSGTRHQGWEALRLGRPLFLMRSLVERQDLEWPREMMRYGAHVLDATEQLLDVIPLDEPDLTVAAF